MGIRKTITNLVQLLSLKNAERLGTDAKGNIVAKTPVDISGKVDKVVGLGLSEHSFTQLDKDKLANLENYTLPDVLQGIDDFRVQNWDNASSHEVQGVSITGDNNKEITLTMRDGSTLTANFTDIGKDTDIKLNSLNWDAFTGVMTAITSDGNMITANIDGRYSLLAHTHSWGEITDKPTNIATIEGLDGKVDKIIGKGLSTNDYTTTEKQKLNAVQDLFAEMTVQSVSTTSVAVGVSASASLFAIRVKSGTDLTLKFGTTSGGEELGSYTGSAGDVVTLSFINARTVYLTANKTGSVVPIIYKFKN